MSTDRELLQMALDALYYLQPVQETRDAIREALARPEQGSDYYDRNDAYEPTIAKTPLPAMRPLPAEREPVAAHSQDALDAARLNAFTPGWELSHCWDGDDDVYWAVHRVSGGRNDREWTLVGRGATVRAAIDAALASQAQEGKQHG